MGCDVVVVVGPSALHNVSLPVPAAAAIAASSERARVLDLEAFAVDVLADEEELDRMCVKE